MSRGRRRQRRREHVDIDNVQSIGHRDTHTYSLINLKRSIIYKRSNLGINIIIYLLTSQKNLLSVTAFV